MFTLDLEHKDYFVKPGFVVIPEDPSFLHAKVGAGVVVALYDPENKRGGMCYYTEPYSYDKTPSAKYSYPAIISLIRLMIEDGSNIADLEAYVMGGAQVSINSEKIIDSVSNLEDAIEILAKKNIQIANESIGGKSIRHVTFNTYTGEIFVQCN